MRRVFLLVLDSLGVGALPDAAAFGDAGAHTLDHLVEAAGGLDAPRLIELGLGRIAGVNSLPQPEQAAGAFGRMTEVSAGKDTPTGHWEMMGCPLDWAFPVFEEGFPAQFLDAWTAACDLPGWLCNQPYSGTVVLEDYGEEHIASGKPIVYTSADSVFQIAAHIDTFGLERLYSVCREARRLLDPLNVGRVIARPFIGVPGAFERTYDRRDYGVEPPSETTLDRLVRAEVPVVGVGKIHDLFAGRGVPRKVHTEGNADGMRACRELARELDGGLVFVNLVDFDSLYGHRRDPLGYRGAIEEFDAQLIELEGLLRDDDIVLMTADHGNDPTVTQNTDHTREYVPILACGREVRAGTDLGTRSTFADLGATIEEAFGLGATASKNPFLSALIR